jgi:hypothetical protein
VGTRSDEVVAAIDRVGAAVRFAMDRDLARELTMICGWGSRDAHAPLLPSGISHGVPWGLSLAIEQHAIEPRLFIEPQADPSSPAAYWHAGLAVTRFAAQHGADTQRLDAILDGIEASNLTPFRLWHAVALTAPPRWHAYLCIPPDLPEVAREALRRAGVTELPPLHARDRISIVSLDLTIAMRVKAYVLMPDASLDDLATLHDRASGAIAGDAQRFGRALLGDDRRIWWLAALGFTESNAPPTSCAIHLGVPRHLDETTATRRIRTLLDEHALPANEWERARAALGAHHFVSLQRRDDEPRVTTYFLPSAAR